jgi:hypothetical protein
MTVIHEIAMIMIVVPAIAVLAYGIQDLIESRQKRYSPVIAYALISFALFYSIIGAALILIHAIIT